MLDTYPLLEPYIEDILPKKEQLDLVKLYVPSFTVYPIRVSSVVLTLHLIHS